jgi:hypothetical protein
VFKLLAIGLWAAGVTSAAAFLSADFFRHAEQQAESAAPAYKGVEQLKTEMTSVPMVRGGVIEGYVVIQLSFAADIATLEQLKLEPQPFLVDAAFRTIYENQETNFARMKSADLDRLTEKIAAEANRRIGANLVKQVLIQQLNYVRREDIRTHWIQP